MCSAMRSLIAIDLTFRYRLKPLYLSVTSGPFRLNSASMILAGQDMLRVAAIHFGAGNNRSRKENSISSVDNKSTNEECAFFA